MKLNSVRRMIIADFFEKMIGREEFNTKVEKISHLWRRSRETLPFLWERSRMDEMETLQEHLPIWENLLNNIYFLLIKFSRISFMDFYLCTFPLFFQMLIKYLRKNVLYEWTALSRQSLRHGQVTVYVKGECFMTMSAWKVFLLIEAIFFICFSV